MGIMFGAAAIALTYPLMSGLSGGEQNTIPRFASQWHVGKGAIEKPTLQYLVNYQGKQFLAEMQFLEMTGDEQNIQITITDENASQRIEETLKLGRAYVFVNPPAEIKPYIQAMDRTIFSIRDTVIEPQYLVVGADWGTIYIGKYTPKLKVTEYEDTEFEFGTIKTYTVSYEINNVKSVFLIADNIPLPLKGNVYTIDGNLDYAFEAIKLEAQ